MGAFGCQTHMLHFQKRLRIIGLQDLYMINQVLEDKDVLKSALPPSPRQSPNFLTFQQLEKRAIFRVL